MISLSPFTSFIIFNHLTILRFFFHWLVIVSRNIQDFVFYLFASVCLVAGSQSFIHLLPNACGCRIFLSPCHLKIFYGRKYELARRFKSDFCECWIGKRWLLLADVCPPALCFKAFWCSHIEKKRSTLSR